MQKKIMMKMIVTGMLFIFMGSQAQAEQNYLISEQSSLSPEASSFAEFLKPQISIFKLLSNLKGDDTLFFLSRRGKLQGRDNRQQDSASGGNPGGNNPKTDGDGECEGDNCDPPEQNYKPSISKQPPGSLQYIVVDGVPSELPTMPCFEDEDCPEPPPSNNRVIDLNAITPISLFDIMKITESSTESSEEQPQSGNINGDTAENNILNFSQGLMEMLETRIKASPEYLASRYTQLVEQEKSTVRNADTLSLAERDTNKALASVIIQESILRKLEERQERQSERLVTQVATASSSETRTTTTSTLTPVVESKSVSLPPLTGSGSSTTTSNKR